MADSHYAILGCDYDSPFEEIKQRYQELALKYHPDKAIIACDINREKFQQINEAWKVLREPESRHRYDAELRHMQIVNQPFIYATLNVNELEFTDETYSYSCRCGGVYLIPKKELLSPESIVECDECSFNILIKS